MDKNQNYEWGLALHIINNTTRNLFLSGRAGTGKTTLLREVMETTRKRHIVLAPTGIAANNANAATIHSFFGFSFEPYVSGANNTVVHLSKASSETIKHLELLLIDEVSMVRVDLLEHIDAVLRQTRNNNDPFGGVQIVLFGDLRQLPPVATPEEIAILKEKYSGLFFFYSQAFNKGDFLYLELKKVYRQQEPHFLKLLDHIRECSLTKEDYTVMNARAKVSVIDDNEKPIRIVTHRRQVEKINLDELAKIPSEEYAFKGDISGNFPVRNLPTGESLVLKEGAQIIFLKNDEDGRFHNGSFGIITSVNKDSIQAIVSETNELIDLEKVKWANISYKYNAKTEQIDTEELGSFSQYPIQLAWAITVHKSQGLTFSKVILDVNASFEAGQAYVAFSRCRSMDGIYLASRVRPRSFINSLDVDAFLNKQRKLSSEAIASFVGFTGVYANPAETEDHKISVLEEELVKWRYEKSIELDVPAYVICWNRTLRGIADSNPKDLEALSSIKGVGKAFLSKYGLEVLRIVQSHTAIEPEFASIASTLPTDEKRKRASAKDNSLKIKELCNEGKSICEMSSIMNLKESTIGIYLSKLILEGDVDAHLFVDSETFDLVRGYLLTNPNCKSSTDIVQFFNGKVSYQQARFVMNSLQSQVKNY